MTRKGFGTVAVLAAVVCTAPGCEEITATSEDVQGETEESTKPGKVTDLELVSSSSNAVTVRWTEVDDGMGEPAYYEVRRHPTPIGSKWGAAVRVEEGSCAYRIEGVEPGEPFSCVIEGLEPSTEYDFQMVAFRGWVDEYGDLSNVASGATADGEAGTPESVVVTPAQATIREVGGTVQFTAEARDAEGNPVPGTSFSWSSSDPEIATVSPEGLVEAKAIGTALIIATVVCGSTGCSDPLLANGEVGVSPANGADPIWVEDFSSYSSLSEFQAVPEYVEFMRDDLMDLDTSILDPQVSSPHTLKYTWFDSGESCSIPTIGFKTQVQDISEKGVEGTPFIRELWARVRFRFSENFNETTIGGDCPTDSGYKWIFYNSRTFSGVTPGAANANNSRYNWKVGVFGNATETGNISEFKDQSHKEAYVRAGNHGPEIFDGQWHTAWLYVRAADVGEFNGIMQHRIDDTLLANIQDHATELLIDRFQWGVNRNNNGVSGTQTLHLSKFELWDEDPGWSVCDGDPTLWPNVRLPNPGADPHLNRDCEGNVWPE